MTKLKDIFIGTEHKVLEDAVAADLVSALPGIGFITDFIRLVDSESKPHKLLQALDFATEPFPIINIITPTNTLIYLDKKGILPFKLSKIENIMDRMKTKQWKK